MSLVQEVSEASLKMLDLCGTTRELFNLAKEELQELQQQIFRKAKIEESNFEAHILDRLNKKKLKKEHYKINSYSRRTRCDGELMTSHVVKSLRIIKEIKSKYFTCDLSEIDHSLICLTVHVLRKVREATISFLESYYLLLHCQLLRTITIIHSQTPLALKFMPMKCPRNLLERCDSMEVFMANKKLGEVMKDVEKLETEFESIMRRLMQTRVLLLNVLTN
ncbi:hypothetical protein RND81_02G061400 [Saponaria officinalis]|uniref:Uncharacterized protein n=1 Tax=Saponaria officinalis TaxID=3572 RepID=A0AAW1MRH7_SAPOF